MIRRADYLVLLFLVSILGLSASQVLFDYCQDDDDFGDNDDSDLYIMLMWRLFVCLYPGPTIQSRSKARRAA